MTLDAGPHSLQVRRYLGDVSRALFRPRGEAPPGCQVIESFQEARRLSLDEEEDLTDEALGGRLPWTDLRIHLASGLGHYEQPAIERTDPRVDALFNLTADAAYAYLPAAWHVVVDDVTADVSVCAQWIALHGELEPLHELISAAYLAGCWPCGWNGGLCAYVPRPEDEPALSDSDRRRIELRQAHHREHLEMDLGFQI